MAAQLTRTKGLALRSDKMLKDPKLTQAPKTEAFYKAYRGLVSYVKQDRIFTDDIRKGAEFLKTW